MTQAEFLDQSAQQLKDHTARIQACMKQVDGVKMNDMPPNSMSIAQILEHLRLSDEIYIKPISDLLVSPIKGDQKLKMTSLGKFLYKVAGPDGNAPIPKVFMPEKRTYGLEVVHQVLELHDKYLNIYKRCEGVDLVANKLRNPVIGFLSMNLYDTFSLLSTHSERHIRQIEARIK